MAAATYTVAQTRSTVGYNATLVTQSYNFTVSGDISIAAANLAPSVLAAALPFGSAQLVLTSGGPVTNVMLLLGNDGILANLVQVGPTITGLTTTTPLMIDLTSGVSSATTDAAVTTLSGMPFVYFNWQFTVVTAPCVINITSILMGARG